MILVIGDLHGKDIWKEKIKDFPLTGKNKIIFLGDYVDTFPPVTDKQIIDNLKEIIELKKAFPNNVVLLLGNHDIQYIYPGCRCSGYRASYSETLQEIFKENIGLFNYSHFEDGYLFSHAGVTTGWLKNSGYTIEEFISLKPEDYYGNDERFINIFDVGMSRGGSEVFGGPFWADQRETVVPEFGTHKGIIQVVGHTPQNTLNKFPHIIYCDTFGKRQSNETLCIE